MGGAWDAQDLDLLWPYVLRMSGVDPEPIATPQSPVGSSFAGGLSLDTKSQMYAYMGVLRLIYGDLFGRNVDERSDDDFLDSLFGAVEATAIFAAIGVPIPATGPREIRLNVGFEVGATNRTRALFDLASLAKVTSDYTRSRGLPSISVIPNFIRDPIPTPSDNLWNYDQGGTDRSTISRLFSGNGIANILFASSRLADYPGQGAIDSIYWPASRGVFGIGSERAGAIIGPNAGTYSLAHELGHILGYRGNAPLNHHSDPNNVMHGPSPRPPRPAYIDDEYYRLLVSASAPARAR